MDAYLSGADRTFTVPADTAKAFGVRYLGMVNPAVFGSPTPVAGGLAGGQARLHHRRGRQCRSSTPSRSMSVFLLSGDADGDQGPWTVVRATSPQIVVTEPAALDRVSSPVAVRGQAATFEGNVLVEVREDGMLDGANLGLGPVTGRGDGVLGDFAGDIAFDRPVQARRRGGLLREVRPRRPRRPGDRGPGGVLGRGPAFPDRSPRWSARRREPGGHSRPRRPRRGVGAEAGAPRGGARSTARTCGPWSRRVDDGWAIRMGPRLVAGPVHRRRRPPSTVVLAPDGPQREDLAPDRGRRPASDDPVAGRPSSTPWPSSTARAYLRWIDATKRRRPDVRAARIAEVRPRLCRRGSQSSGRPGRDEAFGVQLRRYIPRNCTLMSPS